MQLSGDTYETVRERFCWQIPSRLNIAEVIVSRHARATPTAPALIHVGDDDTPRVWSFAEIEDKASRLANALASLGIGRFVRGEPVELHQVMAASEEAGISLEFLVEMRNKLTDAYRSVMNMQV